MTVMGDQGLSFDYERDTWAIELGWQLGHLEFFMGNRNFEGTELGEQIRQREQDWTRAVRATLAGHGATPLAATYESFGDLFSAALARLPEERLKALALIGVATARLSSTVNSEGGQNEALVTSARAVLARISPIHVADTDELLRRLQRAQARTPSDAAQLLVETADGGAPVPAMTFDYDRDLWAVELGATLARLEFAFRNRNFDGTELGEQLRTQEQEALKQVDALLTGRGLGSSRSDYADFDELAGDVLSRLGEERLRALALIGTCVGRLEVGLRLDGETRAAMLLTARRSLDGISPLHVPDPNDLFRALVDARAGDVTRAGVLLAARWPRTPAAPAVPSSQSTGQSTRPSNRTTAQRDTVFISYARQDGDAALRLAKDLEDAGVDVWIDVERLRPGERWRPAVGEAIERSRYFVAVLSSRSVTHRGFVQAELRSALELLREFPESQTFVIPVRLDDTEIVNRELRELNWVDMFPEWRAGLRRLVAGLGAGSPEAVGAAVTQADRGTLVRNLFLGWQLARYEFVEGNDLPEARAIEPQLRAELEILLQGTGDPVSVAGRPSREVIREAMVRALARDVQEHGAILIGIAGLRAHLVGASPDPAHNEEMKRLVFSSLLDVDPAMVPNKHALFDRLLRERPSTPQALAELLQSQPAATR